MRDSKHEIAENEELDPSPFLEYLQTERGHELAARVVGIVEGIQQATLATNSKHVIFELWFKVITVVLIVCAASFLTWVDKFTPTIGLLLGTLLGYVFGKKS